MANWTTNELVQPGAGSPGPTGPQGPKGTTRPRGNAYGFYCRGASKKHIKGQKGTPFSQCVRALAKLDSGKAATPAKACKGVSKKRVKSKKGKKGSPYSQCVRAAAKFQAASR